MIVHWKAIPRFEKHDDWLVLLLMVPCALVLVCAVLCCWVANGRHNTGYVLGFEEEPMDR